MDDLKQKEKQSIKDLFKDETAFKAKLSKEEVMG